MATPGQGIPLGVLAVVILTRRKTAGLVLARPNCGSATSPGFENDAQRRPSSGPPRARARRRPAQRQRALRVGGPAPRAGELRPLGRPVLLAHLRRRALDRAHGALARV